MVRSRRWYPLGFLGVLACSTEPGAPPPPPSPSQLQVDPPQIVLTAGTSFQFNALKSGILVPVVWSLDQPGAGTITQEGVFTHAYCYSSPVQVRARLASDPAVFGVGSAQIAYHEAAFTALRSIELSNGQAARLDSLAGTVNLVAMVAARPYPCRATRKLRFVVVLGVDVMTVDSVLFDPPLDHADQHNFSWSTATIPNGRYQLLFAATRTDGSIDTGAPYTVQVRNP